LLAFIKSIKYSYLYNDEMFFLYEDFNITNSDKEILDNYFKKIFLNAKVIHILRMDLFFDNIIKNDLTFLENPTDFVDYSFTKNFLVQDTDNNKTLEIIKQVRSKTVLNTITKLLDVYHGITS